MSFHSYKLFEPAFTSAKSPLILGIDVRLQSPETLALQYEEAARAATGSGRGSSSSPLLNMAAYGKPQPNSQMQGYSGTTQPYQDAAYPQYSYPEPQRSSYPEPPTHATQLNSASFAANNTLASRQFVINPHHSLLSYAPDTGPAGTRVHLRLESASELGDCIISLLFNAVTAPVAVQRVEEEGGEYIYALTCEAPELSETGSSSNTVPLVLIIDKTEGDGEIGEEIARLTVGEFDYTHDGASSGAGGGGSSPAIGAAAVVTRSIQHHHHHNNNHHHQDNHQDQARRYSQGGHASSSPSIDLALAAVAAAGHSDPRTRLEPQLPGLSGLPALSGADNSPTGSGHHLQQQQLLHRDHHHSQHHHGHDHRHHDPRHGGQGPVDSTNAYDYPAPGSSPQSSHSPYANQFPHNSSSADSNMMTTYRSASAYGGDMYGGRASASASAPAPLRPPTAGGWAPYQPIDGGVRTPVVSHTSISRPGFSPQHTPNPNAPPLVRTSTIPGSASTMGGGPGGMGYGSFSSVYQNKAELKLMGKLDDMAYNWTPEEAENKRRIVHFTKEQRGAMITARFKPISIGERPPNATCVSCIWWAERKECYVTSVDTIALLEALVVSPNKFTVEEKNRIRRNLEGFNPITVSKSKADSESFFRIIMNFSHPRPRNIEKDVKVFPWKTLASSLTKIISKYSASPSAAIQNAAQILPPPSAHPLLGAMVTPQYPLPSMPPPGSGYAYHHGLDSSAPHHLTSPRSMAGAAATAWAPFTSTVPPASTFQSPTAGALRQVVSPQRAPTTDVSSSSGLRTSSPLRLSTTGLPNLGYAHALPMSGLLTGTPTASGAPSLSQSASNTPSTATTAPRWNSFDTYPHQPAPAHGHGHHPQHHSAGPYGGSGYDGAPRM